MNITKKKENKQDEISLYMALCSMSPLDAHAITQNGINKKDHFFLLFVLLGESVGSNL